MKTPPISHLSLRAAVLSLALLTLAASVPSESQARKKGYRLKDATTRQESRDDEMAAGSFMVASQCATCNSGYTIGQVVFAGFDKKLGSAKESFFITNNTDRTMSGITLYIEYLTPDGRQLHKKFVKLTCNIPAGETRKADIPSWDTQHSFYYEKSESDSGKGSPFTVRFDPIAYYLRF